MDKFWTDDRNAELERLIDLKFGAVSIAIQLGAKSKNAVVGQAHRLGLSFNSRGKTKPAAHRGTQEAPKQAEPPKQEAIAAVAAPPKAQPAGGMRTAKASRRKPPSNVADAPRRSHNGDIWRPSAKVDAPASVDSSISFELFVPVANRRGCADLIAGQCRWPMGDPRRPEFHFCDRPKLANRPYCEHHDGVSVQRAATARAVAEAQKTTAGVGSVSAGQMTAPISVPARTSENRGRRGSHDR